MREREPQLQIQVFICQCPVQEKAASYSPPYLGAMFPWESAFTGEECCPTWAVRAGSAVWCNMTRACVPTCQCARLCVFLCDSVSLCPAYPC